MNSKTILKKRICLLFLIASSSLYTSCQPEEYDQGNGLSDPNVDASFTITPIDGSPNSYLLEAQPDDVIINKWDLGDGNPAYEGSTREEIFLPDAETYTITHTATGRGGLSNSTSQNIVVATSDPNAGNLIKGGKFLNATEHSEWTILQLNDTGANWVFNSGSATIVASGFSQQGIYQAIEVEANKEYKIDMLVFGSGATESWFEVYASPTPPIQNEVYSADGNRIGLSTWDGCANTSFNGKLSDVGCTGSGNIVTFAQSGTVYLVIRSGGNNTGSTGISVTNIEFRGNI